MASRTTGTSCTWAPAPPAARRWSSPRRARSPPTAASARTTSASTTTATSTASPIASASSTRRRRSPARSSRTPDGRRAPRDHGMAAASSQSPKAAGPSGPTAAPFADNYPTPSAMPPRRPGRNRRGVPGRAAGRALEAGFDVVELRGAWLPDSRIPLLSSTREPTTTAAHATTASDCVLEIVDAVRAVWPERLPLLVADHRQPTGRRAVGIWSRRSNSRGAFARAVSIWSRQLRSGWRGSISRLRSAPVTKCPSPSASAATPGCRPRARRG